MFVVEKKYLHEAEDTTDGMVWNIDTVNLLPPSNIVRKHKKKMCFEALFSSVLSKFKKKIKKNSSVGI